MTNPDFAKIAQPQLKHYFATRSSIANLAVPFSLSENPAMLESDAQKLADYLSAQLKDRSKAEIARLCGVSTQAVNGWITTGRVAKRHLPRIAKYIGVSIEELLSFEVQKAVRSTPIVGKTQGGSGGYWEELGYPPGYGDGTVEALSKDPDAYALLVEGSSMAPRIREGEAILVEPNHPCYPGDEVVVRLRDGHVMVKEFTSDRGGMVTLSSLSPDHERKVVRRDEIEMMHFVSGVFRAGAIRHAEISTEDYQGTDRRTYPATTPREDNERRQPAAAAGTVQRFPDELVRQTPWTWEEFIPSSRRAPGTKKPGSIKK